MVTINGVLIKKTEHDGTPLSLFVYDFGPTGIRWEAGLIFDTICRNNSKKFVFAFMPVNNEARELLEASFRKVSISMSISLRNMPSKDLSFDGKVQVIKYKSFNCYYIFEIAAESNTKFLLALERGANSNLEQECPKSEISTIRFRIVLR